MELVHLSRGAIPRPTLGASLRAARLDRNITLEAVAAHTKINLAFFRDLERDDLSKWPANQFYRESYLRAYAEAVGLDPDDVIDAFRCEFDAAGTSNEAALVTKPRRLTPVTIPIIVAITFVTLYSLTRWMAASSEDPAAGVGEPAARQAAAEPATPSHIEVQTPEAPAPAPAPAVPPQDVPAAAKVDVDQLEGEMVITSTPSGARVLVNGIARGSTPARVQFLPPGTYTVRFLLPGYSAAMRNVAISPERLRVPVSATLEPVPVPRTQVPALQTVPADDGEESHQKESNLIQPQ